MGTKKYEGWSQEQLLERIESLESEQMDKKRKKKKPRRERPFDMTRYCRRRVAFKVAYLGWNYLGFAAQADNEKTPTVEGHLFRAMKECKLINDPEEANFSRCGRTDKGVSGLGQVISLDVRSLLTQEELDNPELEKAARNRELPYIDTINRLLPPDIRILAWSPVKPDFDARFNCLSRTYKYFFNKGNLNIQAMQKAAEYIKGTHDFRNFCKIDPTKDITNYQRTVIRLDIQPVHTLDTQKLGTNLMFYEVVLTGSAFLWHQVRCIMAILFLVGQELEEPEVVHDLMDIEKCDARPDYPMASDLPLMLYDSEYKDLEWVHATEGNFPSPLRVYGHLQEQWCVSMTRGLMCQTMLGCVNEFMVSDHDGNPMCVQDRVQLKEKPSNGISTVILGGGQEMRMTKYRKLIERKRGDSDKVKKDKYRARKKAKLSN
ncbi:pseudouridine synthase [Phycomyces blakesleeanus]